MLRFKQFTGAGDDLQEQVNGWLEQFEPDVRQMVQTTDGNRVVISFLFEESFRGQELRLSDEHGMSTVESAYAGQTAQDRPIPVPEEPGRITSDLP